MADTLEQCSVAHRLFDDARQSIGRADFLFFRARQDKRAADARLHRVQITELAAADLVHPHPLPGRAEVDDLLGHVAETAQVFPGFLEALGRARRQIPNGLVGLRPLARAQVQVGGPIIIVWLVHRAPKVQAWSRGGTGPDRAAGRTTVAAPPYVPGAPS